VTTQPLVKHVLGCHCSESAGCDGMLNSGCMNVCSVSCPGLNRLYATLYISCPSNYSCSVEFSVLNTR
jgi:hypothetical protein